MSQLIKHFKGKFVCSHSNFVFSRMNFVLWQTNFVFRKLCNQCIMIKISVSSIKCIRRHMRYKFCSKGQNNHIRNISIISGTYIYTRNTFPTLFFMTRSLHDGTVLFYMMCVEFELRISMPNAPSSSSNPRNIGILTRVLTLLLCWIQEE